MQLRLCHCLAALALLLLAACADGPAGPSIDPEEVGPSKIGVWAPGDGGKCDPWQDINWCEDDGACATSQPPEGPDEEYIGVQGCTPAVPPGGGGGGTQPPPSASPDTACKTESPVLNDPAVQAGFKDLWNQSGYELEQQDRREAGAWIIRDANGSHRLSYLADAVRTPCSINGNWNAPDGAVAFVHTHPFTSREVMTACGPIMLRKADGREVPLLGSDGGPVYHRYGNAPSPADRDLLQNVVNGTRKMEGKPAVEGFVIDNERITRYIGANEMKDVGYNRCGY
jgi:hypothetical protein